MCLVKQTWYALSAARCSELIKLLQKNETGRFRAKRAPSLVERLCRSCKSGQPRTSFGLVGTGSLPPNGLAALLGLTAGNYWTCHCKATSTITTISLIAALFSPRPEYHRHSLARSTAGRPVTEAQRASRHVFCRQRWGVMMRLLGM